MIVDNKYCLFASKKDKIDNKSDVIRYVEYKDVLSKIESFMNMGYNLIVVEMERL